MATHHVMESTPDRQVALVLRGGRRVRLERVELRTQVQYCDIPYPDGSGMVMDAEYVGTLLSGTGMSYEHLDVGTFCHLAIGPTQYHQAYLGLAVYDAVSLLGVRDKTVLWKVKFTNDAKVLYPLSIAIPVPAIMVMRPAPCLELAVLLQAVQEGDCPTEILADYLEEQGDDRAQQVRESTGNAALLLFPEWV